MEFLLGRRQYNFLMSFLTANLAETSVVVRDLYKRKTVKSAEKSAAKVVEIDAPPDEVKTDPVMFT